MSDRPERSESRGPAAVSLQSLEEDEALVRRRRGRVVLAVVVAALLEAGVIWVMQNRSDAPPRRAAAASPEPKTASVEAPPPIDIDLRRESDEAASRLALTLELASTNEVYQPSEIPVFDDPPPLGRDRLEFSAALGDGDAGRGGVAMDELLPQVAVAARAEEVRAPAADAPPAATPTPAPQPKPQPTTAPRAPRPRPAPARAARPVADPAAAPVEAAAASPPVRREPAASRPSFTPAAPPAAPPATAAPEPVTGTDDLVDLQTRAAAEAAAQPVQMNRMPPRERPLPSPDQEAAAAQAAAQVENRRFFGDVTARLIQANQQALAEAVRAGTRETVDVRFSVDADGRIGEPTVVSTGASPELAAVATRIVAAASPLPRPPAAMVRGGPLRLTYPVQVYR